MTTHESNEYSRGYKDGVAATGRSPLRSRSETSLTHEVKVQYNGALGSKAMLTTGGPRNDPDPYPWRGGFVKIEIEDLHIQVTQEQNKTTLLVEGTGEEAFVSLLEGIGREGLALFCANS
jgi:hypothetical protein